MKSNTLIFLAVATLCLVVVTLSLGAIFLVILAQIVRFVPAMQGAGSLVGAIIALIAAVVCGSLIYRAVLNKLRKRPGFDEKMGFIQQKK